GDVHPLPRPRARPARALQRGLAGLHRHGDAARVLGRHRRPPAGPRRLARGVPPRHSAAPHRRTIRHRRGRRVPPVRGGAAHHHGQPLRRRWRDPRSLDMNARSDVLPLSAAQAGIWWGQQLDPTSPLYNTAEALEIEGPLDVPAFLAALQTVLAGCEALHRRFVAHGDTAEQHACVPPEPCTASLDWRGRADARAAMWTWIAEDLRRPVDLAVGPLYRSVLFTLADDHHVWLLRAHHIALDGFAFSLLRERLWQHYRALVQGSAPPRPVEIGLRDVIAEDQA